MTPQQEKQFQIMESQLEEVLANQHENAQKLDEVLSCLKGNNLGEDGLIKRMHLLEEEARVTREDRIGEKATSKVYIRIIAWLATVIGALVAAYIFNQALNHN